ncbi:hypothetical protein MBMB1_0048 [Methanobacterium sp. MB1]|nr:hypothetical protein MBMB1_0048 [Methanobacterium sp. MB1]
MITYQSNPFLDMDGFKYHPLNLRIPNVKTRWLIVRVGHEGEPSHASLEYTLETEYVILGIWSRGKILKL